MKIGFVGAGLSALLAAHTFAQPAERHPANYPAKPVRMVIPYASGGPPDAVARIVGDKVTPKLPVKSMKELIAYAQANTGKLNFDSRGVGSVGHLAAELLASVAKVKMAHVPYTGMPAMITDIIGGQIELAGLQVCKLVWFVVSCCHANDSRAAHA